MREIKFRAWDREYKKWYMRVLVGTDCNNRVYDEELDQWFEFDELCGDVVQYTGHKNRDGKELYFDDIIDIFVGKNKYMRKVIRELDDLFFLLNMMNDFGASFEIIGNIHNNPELIP
jgi:hypothetical protein